MNKKTEVFYKVILFFCYCRSMLSVNFVKTITFEITHFVRDDNQFVIYL